MRACSLGKSGGTLRRRGRGQGMSWDAALSRGQLIFMGLMGPGRRVGHRLPDISIDKRSWKLSYELFLMQCQLIQQFLLNTMLANSMQTKLDSSSGSIQCKEKSATLHNFTLRVKSLIIRCLLYTFLFSFVICRTNKRVQDYDIRQGN